MQRYQIKTGELAAQKLVAAGGESSRAKEILDGLKWRLGRDPNLTTYVVDQKMNVHLIKSEKRTPKDPIITATYRILKGDPYYDIEIIDLRIIS